MRETVRSLVTKGQLEFSLAGWSGSCHEGVSYEDLLADYADAQQWSMMSSLIDAPLHISHHNTL